MVRLFILPFLFFAILGTSASQAADLTEAQVKQFVDAIPDIETFSADMKKQGKDKALEAAVRPKPGETSFSPYAKGVTVLKTKFPDDYKSLGTITGKHGFASQESWAITGDSVMQAYLATKMEGQNMQALKAMAEMSPEMKAKLPPQTRMQMEQASAMMKLVNDAPAANRAAIKPHLPAIDAWLQREGSKMKAAKAGAAQVKPTIKVTKNKSSVKPLTKQAK